MGIKTSFWTSHFWIPLLFFVGVFAVWNWGQFDLVVGDWLYALEGHRWSLKEAFITQKIIHQGGRYVVIVACTGWLLLLLASFFIKKLARFRVGFFYTFLCVSTSLLIIGALKAATHVHCPWDLTRYQGDVPYISIFTALPATIHKGRCFPAGHAGGAYAWVCLYYVFLLYRPRYRFWVLGLSLLWGAIYGFGQELRGAHFISHDFVTIGICWMVATVLFYGVERLFLKKDVRPSQRK